LRWVFQCFMAVHFVVFQEAKQIVNLTASPTFGRLANRANNICENWD
jgi:hypothetical protein